MKDIERADLAHQSEPQSIWDDSTPNNRRASNNSFASYVVGVVIGGILTGVAIPLTLVIAFVAGKEGRDPNGELLGLIPGAIIILGVVVFSVNHKTRRFGLGLLTGIPLGVLTVVAICGGLK